MLELITTFKMCLGLLLLTGLITGYLYTLFSVKEEYQPKIDELTKSIIHSNEQTESLEAEYEKLHENLQAEQHEIEKIDKKIHKSEQNISIQKKSLDALHKAVRHLEEEYSSVASILKTQTEHRNQLKEEIGFDTVSSLSQKINEQKSKLQKIETKIEKETILLNDTQERHDRIFAQKESFQTERDKHKNKLEELREKLTHQKEKLSTFEDELKNQIKTLTSEAKEWLAKIEVYKAKLLQLKENV